MEDYFLIFLSLLMAGISVVAFGRSPAKPFLRFFVAPALFALLFISILYMVADYFTDAGINEAVIFHLKYGVGGAGFSEYSQLIAGGVVCIVLSLILSGFVFHYFSFSQTGKRSRSIYFGVAGFVALCLGYIINPATADLYVVSKEIPAVESSDESRYIFDENFVYPSALGFPDEPLNLVYIYLESLEQTYFDEKQFPGLVPGLKSLKKQSLSFSHILQVTNTGWTIAGITASQCGIPLVTTGKGNSMSRMDDFLPGAVCIGDLLADAGYSLNYMGGASLEFAGKGKFYKTHGFIDVRGLDELRPAIGADVPVSKWGLYDPDLLQLSMNRFVELSESGKPFGLFMLTLDTHHPKGHIPSQCVETVYGDGSNPMLNAVHCSDKVISSFIEKIRESEYSDRTIIVVGSDHLAFRNLAYEQLSKLKRRNLFFINLPEKIEPARIDKIGSTLDIGPTVMTQLGFDMQALGLGRDLLGSEQTIVEKKRGDIYDYLKSLNNDLMKLWNFPQLDDGLRIVPGSEAFIEFGDRKIRFPVLISVNDTFDVEKITFSDYSPRGLVDHVAELDSDQLFLWIDVCKNVSHVLLDTTDLLGRAVCVSAGSLDAERIQTRVIETKDPLVLSRQDIVAELSDILKQNRPDEIRYSERMEYLEPVSQP